MAWHSHTFVSEALRGNALGDPYERPLHVWSPEHTTRRYPSVYVIQGMTGMVDAWFNVEPWSASYPDRIAALDPQAVVVLVDAFTAVGGSQYVDSPGIGKYHTYLCEELVPFVDATYPTLAGAAHRGIQGKSSGGYGSMITPLLRPDLFGGLATHAGDALFEVCYARDFAPAARALREAYGGSYDAFWADFRSGRPVLSSPHDELLVNTYAMAAAYSARAGRHSGSAVRHRDGRGDRGGLAALAALRPGAARAGATARRDAEEHARDLDRLREERRVPPSISARRRSIARSSPRGLLPTACTSSSFPARTAG